MASFDSSLTNDIAQQLLPLVAETLLKNVTQGPPGPPVRPLDLEDHLGLVFRARLDRLASGDRKDCRDTRARRATAAISDRLGSSVHLVCQDHR